MSTYAVVTPSRGLVHSRTIEAVMANVEKAAAEPLNPKFGGWLLTHDLPIPNCDEHAAELGLATGAAALWFIEEDVVPPRDALAASFAMLHRGFDVVAVDYPVGAPSDAWGCLVRDDGSEITWCGLGCTLIRREVFEKLARPWFTSDYVYVKRVGTWEPQLSRQAPEQRYGQQDIHFCFALRRAGFVIGQVPGMIAGHAWVETMGRAGTNVGYHTIQIRERIDHQWPGPQ